MTIVDNYLFVDEKGHLTLKKRGTILIGTVSGDKTYPDGIRIKVVSKESFFIGEGELYTYEVRTVGGKVFYLKKPHPDYEDYIHSVAEGYSVLTNWNLYGDRNKGYRISGILEDGKRFSNDVYFQNGNKIVMYDGNMIFVDWGAYSKGVLSENLWKKKFLDLDYETECLEFCGFKTRPKLPL